MIELLKAQPAEYHAQIMDLLRREVIEMAVMLHLDFADQPLRLTNRNVPFEDLQYGHKWGAGSGLLVALPQISGGDDQLAPFREYNLGFPADLIDNENWMAELVTMVGDVRNYRNRDAGLYQQLFDPATGQPVGNPIALDTGVMDKMTCGFQPDGAVLSLTTESFLARKGVPVYGQLTYFDQKRRHPTDEGLQFTTEAGKLVVWTNW